MPKFKRKNTKLWAFLEEPLTQFFSHLTPLSFALENLIALLRSHVKCLKYHSSDLMLFLLLKDILTDTEKTGFDCKKGNLQQNQTLAYYKPKSLIQI